MRKTGISVQQRQRLRAAAGGAVAAVLAVTSADAGSFFIREQSARGIGQAFAGIAADSSDLSAMFWNPATITGLPGWRTTVSASGIFSRAYLSPTAGTAPFLLPLGPAGNMAPNALLPAFSASGQIGEKLWLGLSVNAPDGLSSNPNNPSSSQIYGLKSAMKSVEIAPSLAFRFSEQFSIGASLRFLNLRLKEETALAPFPNAPLSILKGDGWGVGYSLGATWRPVAGTELGVGYRSRISPTIEGALTFGVPLPGPIPAGSYPIKMTLPAPEMVTASIRQAVGEAFTLSGTFEWTRWSILKALPITGSPIPGQSAPFFHRNGWMASIGGEYRVNDSLKLRAGLGYEKSPVTTAVREIRNPDANRKWVSVGMSYQVNDQLAFDLAYAHYPSGKVNVAIVPGNPHFALVGVPFVGQVKGRMDIVSLGLNYRWDAQKAR